MAGNQIFDLRSFRKEEEEKPTSFHPNLSINFPEISPTCITMPSKWVVLPTLRVASGTEISVHWLTGKLPAEYTMVDGLLKKIVPES